MIGWRTTTDVDRHFATYVGVDLGGARGKTTAIARLTLRSPVGAEPGGDARTGAAVLEVSNRHRGGEPWTDDVLCRYLGELDGPAVLAINAPLTVPACLRCQLAVCPGREECVDPAVVWLEQRSVAAARESLRSDRDRIAVIPTSTGSFKSQSVSPPSLLRPRLDPYTHRATEVELHFQRRLLPRDAIGAGTGPIAARGVHLRRRLAQAGYELNRDLLEVSPRATVAALFGPRHARGYKRDADPWHTRAEIIEGLSDLRFAPASRFAREEVLRNDHCFEALLSAYTAYLWARDSWQMPAGVFAEDGWIWAPPE